MRTAIVLILLAILLAAFPLRSCRNTLLAHNAKAHHQALMEAIGKRDVEAVRQMKDEEIDIYATDRSGESPISLAEKSGDPRLLDALKPWRRAERDLWRAQKAVEAGTSIGLQRPPHEPEFSVFALVQEEKRKAAQEGRPEPTLESLASTIEEKINALSDTSQKEWARRNYATELANTHLTERARAMALLLADPRMRIHSLLYIGQAVPRGPELDAHFVETRHQIDTQLDAGARDPFLAELAHLENIRGYPDLAHATCESIAEAPYKTGSCRRP